MASPIDTLDQQNEGGHRCISPPIIGGDPDSRLGASIRERLNGVPSFSSDCCIYRVPEILSKINEEAYTPQWVSIGPFHHGQENLQLKETLKWQYLRSFLDRNSDITLPQYAKTLLQMEKRARQSYAEIINANRDEFVTMMIVDGCFILEFLLTNLPLVVRDDQDSVSSVSNATPPLPRKISDAIKCDLILLENQLPFFVLECLYKLNIRDRHNSISLIDIIRISFSHMVPTTEQVFKENSANCTQVIIKQLLASVSGCALLRENGGGTQSVSLVDMPDQLVVGTPQIMHLLHFVRDCCIPSSSANKKKTSLGNDEKELELPHNVTQLREAGVKFEVGRGKCLLDISFKKGVLSIPRINIQDWTEPLLRNMIAFEQLHCVVPQYVTDYVALLGSLIDSSKDIILLREEGIIKTLLGHHEKMSLLFNNLVKDEDIDPDDFYFSDIYEDLNAYYRVPWHTWKANLKHTYFKTPWTAISVIAAAVLLVLTFLQTIYTVKYAPRN